MPSATESTSRSTKRARGEPAGTRRLRRALLLSVLAGTLACVGYALVVWTGVFSIREVRVTGGPEEVTTAVEHALTPVQGERLVGLDVALVKELARGVPGVLAAQVERDFPETLRVRLTLEQPVALVRSGDSAWVVSARGRVIRASGPDTARELPRIWLASGYDFEPGEIMSSEEATLAAQALGRLPAEFPMRVLSARGSISDLTVVVDADRKLELRLGEASSFRLKLAIATRILSALPAAEARALAYLDVSVPERPVAASNLKSKLEG